MSTGRVVRVDHRLLGGDAERRLRPLAVRADLDADLVDALVLVGRDVEDHRLAVAQDLDADRRAVPGLDDLADRVLGVDHLAVRLDENVARLQAGRGRGAVRRGLLDPLRLRRDAVAQQHEEHEDDRGQVVRRRPGQHGQQPHPARPVRVDHRVRLVELFVRVQPGDLDEAAQRNRARSGRSSRRA